MPDTWKRLIEARFQEKANEDVYRGARLLVALAAALFPAFFFLDYFTQRERFWALAAVRLATSLFFGLLFVATLGGRLRSCPFFFSYLVLGTAAFSISVMCVITGGQDSPYYAGNLLVMVAAGVVMHWNANRMAGAMLLVLFVYLVSLALGPAPYSFRPEPIINNIYFLGATGIIGTAGAHFSWNARRESFFRLGEIERARDFLQAELATGQNSLETLLIEAAEKRRNLEDALQSLNLARNRALEAIRLRDDFISLASHELKTPLTSMQLQVQLARKKMIQSGDQTDAGICRLVETFASQTERLIGLVDGMFEGSAARTGKLELNRSSVSLLQSVKRILEEFRPRLKAEGVQVILNAEGDPVGSWDHRRLEQVITNLLSNALKYGERKPVEILVKRGELEAELSVRDSGPGIPAEERDRIFGQFERIRTSKGADGLGLGLYVSREIVEAHGGTIRVESEPGKGATFIVTLPLEARPATVES